MSRRRTHRSGHRTVPLNCADGAIHVARLACHEPLQAETVCLLADDGYQPLSCIVVEGGGQPDDVFPVAELIQELSHTLPVAVAAVVSCRPGHGFEPDDVDRWHELSTMLAEAGVELLDWFIQDEALLVAVTPLAGEVSRWPC